MTLATSFSSSFGSSSSESSLSQASAPTVEDRRSEFVATGGGTDNTSAELLLGTAYVLMWLFAFVMIVRTYQKQAKLGTRIAELEAALARQLDHPPGSRDRDA